MKKLFQDVTIFVFVSVVAILALRGIVEGREQIIDWLHRAL